MSVSRILLFCGVVILWSGPSAAQYMRLTTDNPADSAQLRPSGTTIVTVTLDTNHDRNGSLQTCNSHTRASGCGINNANQLDLFSYALAFRVVGGTVQWGTFSFADPFFEFAPQKQNDTEVEVNGSQASITNPGLIVLGTLPVTILSGAPTILAQIGPGALNVSGTGTWFWTHCGGMNIANHYLIGDPSDPCGMATGRWADWVDFDGVYTGSPVTSPAVKARWSVNGNEGSPLTPIQVTATDPDAARTLTLTQSGMPADLTFTTDPPGPSPRTATVSGTPGFNDAGSYMIVFTVNDDTGLSSVSTVTRLVIANVTPTLLDPIADMTGGCSVVDQAIRATNADSNPIAFSFSGPPFMTVTSNGQNGTVRTGAIHLALAPNSSGTYAASVTASSTSVSDTKSFLITVPGGNCPPVLTPIAAINLSAGDALDRAISAQDPNGEPLSFSKVAGPGFMTVTTTSPGTGTATGNIHLATSTGDAGTYNATVGVTDGSATDSKSFTVNVCANCRPALDPVADMTVNERSTADQALHATDPQGFSLTFTKTLGPTFMTVTRTHTGSTADGNIHLAPALGDSGTYSASVRVSDGTYFTDDAFLVTVNPSLITGVSEVGLVSSFGAAKVAPNPLNGDATVTYRTTRTGFVRIDLYDIQGRLVLRLVDESALAAGTHQATIDGRGKNGEKMPSGVYYVRGASSEGEFKRLITILK